MSPYVYINISKNPRYMYKKAGNTFVISLGETKAEIYLQREASIDRTRDYTKT